MPVRERQREPDAFDPTSEQPQVQEVAAQETQPPTVTEELREVLTLNEVSVEYAVTVSRNYNSVKYSEGNRFTVTEGVSPEDQAAAYKEKVRKLVTRVNQIAIGRAEHLLGKSDGN